jgi:membrane-bound lytic murein transglycosylase D
MLKKSDRSDRKVRRRPGYPVSSLSRLNQYQLLGQESLGVRAFYRSLVLLDAGLLLVAASLLFGESSATVPAPPPHVAEIAPSLGLPLEMNAEVERWMERFLTDQRPAFIRYLEREGLYSGMIRQRLRSRGMPEELMYLAAIESEYTPWAISRVSAMGMWQFMGPTAQSFGLRIDEYVDERRDPVRATEAALDYLQALHERFGSWYMAAAAYNAGPSRVARVVRNHTGGTEGEQALYWEIVDDLPSETRAYVPKMLAAILLGQAAEEYGFEVEPAQPIRFDRVWVPGGTTLKTVAQAVDVPLALIRELNLHLLRGVTPPGEPFGIRVPVGSSPMVVASLGGRWRRYNVDD